MSYIPGASPTLVCSMSSFVSTICMYVCHSQYSQLSIFQQRQEHARHGNTKTQRGQKSMGWTEPGHSFKLYAVTAKMCAYCPHSAPVIEQVCPTKGKDTCRDLERKSCHAASPTHCYFAHAHPIMFYFHKVVITRDHYVPVVIIKASSTLVSTTAHW